MSIASYPIFPARLGGQRGIALFLQYLAQHCDLVCVTVKANAPDYAKGYRIYNILSNSPLRYINVFYFFPLRRIIRKEKITHVILEHPYYGWLGMLLKIFCGVKLVIHSHNIEALRWKSLRKWWWRILFRYEGSAHRHADFNLFIHDADREYATLHYKLEEDTCITCTYGIELSEPPSPSEKQRCRQLLLQEYGLSGNTKIFLFNGLLSYAPNLHAVKIIVEEINPLLLKQGLDYRIIICGKGLPASMNELKDYADKNIIYAGFVDDITVYFKGADVFLNPVVEGGGVKTKLVETLGYDTAAVSTSSGATGITKEDAGAALVVVGDTDRQQFVDAIIKQMGDGIHIAPAFFDKFYWGNIARKTIAFLGR